MTNRSREKLSSLIAVRFTREELERLQDAADEQGLGASTLARMLINQALKPVGQRPRRITSEEFRDVMATTISRLDNAKVDNFLNDVSVGNPEDPAMLIWAGQTKKWEEFTALFLKGLLASLGIEVITSESKDLPGKVKALVNTPERAGESSNATSAELHSRSRV